MPCVGNGRSNRRAMITVRIGDITNEDVDAIVNAANSGLKGGGGVDGAIHRAAGPSVLRECRKIGRCESGSAVITNAGKLKAKRIIHAVGPVWRGGNDGEPLLLRSAYENCFKLARENKIRTIAFPAISTGVYGYPIEKAAAIAVGVGKKYNADFDEIIFVCFSERDFDVYNRVMPTISPSV